jgi:putative FmdB family regulatory protein
MPTYEYACEACRHAFEQWQSMTDEKLVKCPKCGKKKLVRLLGTGAGVIFKGSGFYETDYKRQRSAPSSEGASSSTPSPSSSPATSSDSSSAPSSPAPAKEKGSTSSAPAKPSAPKGSKKPSGS